MVATTVACEPAAGAAFTVIGSMAVAEVPPVVVTFGVQPDHSAEVVAVQVTEPVMLATEPLVMV